MSEVETTIENVETVITFVNKIALDLKLLTVLGVSVKDGENAIGKYGTGVKYALSVLAREKVPTYLILDGVEYELRTVKDEFRNKDFDVVYLNEIALPFCTNYGLNWTLEDAYRELASNNIDEDGEIYVGSPNENSDESTAGTVIIVHSPDMCEIHSTGEVMLNKGDYRLVSKNFYCEMFVTHKEGQTIPRRIYFQGIKSFEFEPDSNPLFLYNFLNGVNLSEDRKISSIWNIEYNIKMTVVSLIKDRDLLLYILEDKEEDVYEHSLDYASSGHTPSEQFIDIALELKRKGKLADCFNKVISNSSSTSAITRAAPNLTGFFLERTLRYLEFLRQSMLNGRVIEPIQLRVSSNRHVKETGYMWVRDDRVLLIAEGLLENFNAVTQRTLLKAILEIVSEKDLLLVKLVESYSSAYAKFAEQDAWDKYKDDHKATILVQDKKVEEENDGS